MPSRSADFRLSSGFRDHLKIVKLERRLGLAGLVSWIQLLAYTSLYKCDGRLDGMDAEDVAIAARWTRDASEFVDALVELKLLERRGKTLMLHDWADHNGYAAAFSQRSEHAKKAAQTRWNRRTMQDADTMPEHSPSNARAMQAASNSDAPSPDPDPSPEPDLKNKRRSKSDGLKEWFDATFVVAFPLECQTQTRSAQNYLLKVKPDDAARTAYLALAAKWSPVFKSRGYFPGLHTFLTEPKYQRDPGPSDLSQQNGHRPSSSVPPPTIDELIASQEIQR